MIQDHPQVCLFQPEIPQNTGNIGRLCAVTQCRLHLIQPFGFDASDKQLRRAGLDYWPYLDLEVHRSLEDLLSRFQRSEVAFMSKFGKSLYSEMGRKVKLIIFGQETSGLPNYIHAQYSDRCFRLPMFHPEVRSLNLANAVSAVVYHRLEGAGWQSQQSF
ncbi:MAG: tRNA (cytidine(34)-2'-O)-methyltransferase [Zetaproteobacteria bacterium]|nr:tRNA (cytidine(34)-2'-O)-methyltransferase [Zetaproteobacteria bacterium]